MSEYRRPEIESLVFFDEGGNVIDYGNRWPEGPPDDSYSAITHPERFAPLHAVADSLIRYLASNYQVHVDEGIALLRGIGERPFDLPDAEDIDRVVRLVPEGEDCSPLLFVYTSYPGLCIYAGMLGAFIYPDCGCDACDETWEGAVESLEEDVLAIVGGRYREMVDVNPLRRIGYRPGLGIEVGMGRTYGWQLEGADGSSSKGSVGDASAFDASVLKATKKRLKALAEVTAEGNWKAWPIISARR